MIKVTTVNKDNIYDSKVDVHGNYKQIIVELKSLFEVFINSKDPEVIHAVISYYLPVITE